MIVNADCKDYLPTLPDNSIELLITSPPYNVDLGNGDGKDKYESHNDNLPYPVYIEWLESIFTLAYPKMKEFSRVCINIGDGKNGAIPTHSDVIQFMKRIGYSPYSTIIWNKKHTNSRSAWGSFMKPSRPSFPSPFEYILIFSKGLGSFKKEVESDITKEEFVSWSLGLWEIPPKKFKGHPATFPEEIPYRLIKLLSYPGDTVLDPFSGSGTTGVACNKLEREYIGIEKSKVYYELSLDRIGQASLSLF